MCVCVCVFVCVCQYPSADAQYLSFLKQLMAIRSDCRVVSLISEKGHYTFLYGHTKHNREGGRKEQTRAWVIFKRKEGEVTLFVHPVS